MDLGIIFPGPMGPGILHLRGRPRTILPWFDIVSIISLESTVPSKNLLPFVDTQRPTREQQQRFFKRPPLSTSCIVQLAPSPQGPLHMRSKAGGPQALEAFLEREPLSPSAVPTPVDTSSRSTPIKRSSSAQVPTRAKLSATALPHLSSEGQADCLAGTPLITRPSD